MGWDAVGRAAASPKRQPGQQDGHHKDRTGFHDDPLLSPKGGQDRRDEEPDAWWWELLRQTSSETGAGSGSHHHPTPTPCLYPAQTHHTPHNDKQRPPSHSPQRGEGEERSGGARAGQQPAQSPLASAKASEKGSADRRALANPEHQPGAPTLAIKFVSAVLSKCEAKDAATRRTTWETWVSNALKKGAGVAHKWANTDNMPALAPPWAAGGPLEVANKAR